MIFFIIIIIINFDNNNYPYQIQTKIMHIPSKINLQLLFIHKDDIYTKSQYHGEKYFSVR